MSNGIEAGKIVELKSGGPYMTVERIFASDNGLMAECDWFDGTTRKNGSFFVTSLKPIEDKK